MQPTNDDSVEITRVLSLLNHLMDDHEMDRLGECLTEYAFWDGSVFGFEPAIGLDEIASVLSADGHARAHHTTNIVVSEAPGEEVHVQSKGLGLRADGSVVSVVFTDDLRHTADGWRISKHVIHVK
ncbi:nuclear transport factor 2 family protein [Streptomyces sp. KM273126]|uniref:nuclear transport factor 2 family protein n=1 Tax=Streptomyces sp. KM273126 TaxID=2545247 RepID=UPI00103D6756|nr:nuclear transport factor 2 family protein [Streptomyces sp. KM273126]MBA2811473.1 nuclear transport factor 2 family protein [Streptomyces sp. KM273126]